MGLHFAGHLQSLRSLSHRLCQDVSGYKYKESKADDIANFIDDI